MKLTKRKGFNFFRSYYDVFNELTNKEDKLSFIESLLDRQFQGVKPKDLKGMAKFAWISQVNSIDSQVKGYEDKTKTKLTPCQGGVNTPTEQVEEKGEVQGKEKVEEKYKKKKVFNFRKSLIDLGAKENIVIDWLKVRKDRKASNTKTAFKIFKNEVEKSKYNINEILTVCVSESWKGFKSTWELSNYIENKPNINPNNEEIITFNSNVNPTIFKLPKSKFLDLQERNKAGGYIYKIIKN